MHLIGVIPADCVQTLFNYINITFTSRVEYIEYQDRYVLWIRMRHRSWIIPLCAASFSASFSASLQSKSLCVGYCDCKLCLQNFLKQNQWPAHFSLWRKSWPYFCNLEEPIDWSRCVPREENWSYPEKGLWEIFGTVETLLTFNLLILNVISCIPPTGTRSLPVVNSRNFFCSISL